MDINLENLQIWYDSDGDEDNKPFLVACRDREVLDGERWVITSLSVDQARSIRDYLNTFLEKDKG